MSDIFTYLVKQFEEDRIAGRKEVEQAWYEDTKDLILKADAYHDDIIRVFVEFCRKQLQANPPMSMYTAIQGIGLKLTDGTEVPILPQPEPSMQQDHFMPITTLGKGGMANSPTLAIFGVNHAKQT